MKRRSKQSRQKVKEEIKVRGNDSRGNNQEREEQRRRKKMRRGAYMGHVGSQGDCQPEHVSQKKPFRERFVIQKNVACFAVVERNWMEKE